MSQEIPSFIKSGWRKLMCGKSADRRAKAIEYDLKDPISYSSDPCPSLKTKVSCTVGSKHARTDQTAIVSYKLDKAPSYSPYKDQPTSTTGDACESELSTDEQDSRTIDGNQYGGKYILEFDSGTPTVTEVIGIEWENSDESGYRLLLSKGNKNGRKISRGDRVK
ncbi:uncharacterized protein B0J16DRAFT_163989 [Fusarium flagelliforme]|uniref:Uncharacterized protein n=1 Tax=Fusarium flagelliforme TaxID=2675880 RepID=A0A395N3N4_9HYPO|nr:uncharacterized protein B0J16DRAFT_163989 [Fusarium flagelliforme]KAH7183394.1 hypothetical protein B0J16DRAFT_163989 [Fusarium flagelliforme]RFN54189.1 hypothetical protein FIE12Z_1315 [Fusarium flagelliforme]